MCTRYITGDTDMKIAIFGDSNTILDIQKRLPEHEIAVGDWDACDIGVVLPGARPFPVFLRHCSKQGIPVVHPRNVDTENLREVLSPASAMAPDVPGVGGAAPARGGGPQTRGHCNPRHTLYCKDTHRRSGRRRKKHAEVVLGRYACWLQCVIHGYWHAQV